MPRQSPGEIQKLIASLCPGTTPQVSFRWWRWLADISDERLAFIAEDRASWERLSREAALLSRIAPNLKTFQTPTVESIDEVRRVQIRRKVTGSCQGLTEALIFGAEAPRQAEARYEASLLITKPGERLARDLGRALAALHEAISAREAAALGFAARDHLRELARIEQVMRPHRALDDLREALPGLRRWFAALAPSRVLCHRDIQTHNFTIDPNNGALIGIFDFEDAALDHRAEELKYMPSYGVAFTRLVLAEYNQASPQSISLEEIGCFHILSALEHFLFIEPDNPRWPEIALWARAAIRSFTP